MVGMYELVDVKTSSNNDLYNLSLAINYTGESVGFSPAVSVSSLDYSTTVPAVGDRLRILLLIDASANARVVATSNIGTVRSSALTF